MGAGDPRGGRGAVDDLIAGRAGRPGLGGGRLEQPGQVARVAHVFDSTPAADGGNILPPCPAGQDGQVIGCPRLCYVLLHGVHVASLAAFQASSLVHVTRQYWHSRSSP